MRHLDHRFGALLPFEIESSISQQIVDFVVNTQKTVGGARSLHVLKIPQEAFWKSFTLMSTEKNIPHNSQPKGLSDFWQRHHTELDWQWISSDITDLVKNEISKIRHLYLHLNRVKILLQNPGTTVPMHKDPVAGSKYGGQVFSPPDPDIEIKENTYHRDQNYLCIKIPLTSQPKNNGEPRLEIGGKRYRYEVGRNFFLLNEIEMTHGADPVDFYRGVIFIDGLLNMEAVGATSLKSIPMVSL